MSNIHDNKILPVPGIKFGTTCSGSKYENRDDLLLIELTQGSTVAAVFTQNVFCAAPVVIAKQHLAQAMPRYLLINAGNANAGTGRQGLTSGESLCQTVAEVAECELNEVLPFSTGVIGEQLSVQLLENAIPSAYKNLDNTAWSAAASAILTTDLVAKTASTRIEIEGTLVTISGICKGSGMINPNMATMLAYIASDVSIAPELLQSMIDKAVQTSFNAITVDGDTSTNDACILIATQKANNPVIADLSSSSSKLFLNALVQVFERLAQQIVRDGEGATKFVTLSVSGADSNEDAQVVAYTVAHSPLVKTALFASDPNWGRILAAIGRAPITTLDIEAVNITLDDTPLIVKGELAKSYSEEKGAAVFAQSDIAINISLGNGPGKATVWTTDLSYDYVKINAEYRS